MATYIGTRGFGAVGVFVKRCPAGPRVALDPRVDLLDLGGAFGWGRFDHGAAQTALALLADHLGRDREREALHLWTGFSATFLAPIAADHWCIDGEEIDEYIALLRDDPVGFAIEGGAA
jgi:hypothetical protein